LSVLSFPEKGEFGKAWTFRFLVGKAVSVLLGYALRNWVASATGSLDSIEWFSKLLFVWNPVNIIHSIINHFVREEKKKKIYILLSNLKSRKNNEENIL
jgi:hypothetical protein